MISKFYIKLKILLIHFIHKSNGKMDNPGTLSLSYSLDVFCPLISYRVRTEGTSTKSTVPPYEEKDLLW